jgi:hypothetical protein
MNQRQYVQALKNRQPREAEPLLAAARDGQILRDIARAARLHERAMRAWSSIVRREWLAATGVAGVEGGALTIEVQGVALLERLRSRAAMLGRELAALAPGVSSIRFVARPTRPAQQEQGQVRNTGPGGPRGR